MLRAAVVVLTAGFVLSGCGGGGGSGGNDRGGGGNGILTVMPSSLTFEAISEGAVISPRTVSASISGVSASTVFLNIQVTGNAVAGITNIFVSGNSGSGEVQPVAPRILGAGTYTSTITVTACTSNPQCTSGLIGTPQTINVTYNIHGVRSSVANLAYTVNDSILAADLSRTLNVTGYPSQTWTATSSVPWLTVTPTSGNAGTATSVTAALVQSEVERLESGSHTVAIALTPATSGSPFTVPVTLNVSRTRVNYVSPYVTQAGLADTVIIRGENLSQYAITGVRFGSTPAASFTVVSDTEVHAQHPPLPAGQYDVHLINSEGVGTTRATLVVVETPTYAPATLNYPSIDAAFIRCAVYDAERAALIAVVAFNSPAEHSSQLMRFPMASGWTAATTLTLPSDASCALTPDGRRIVVGRRETTSAHSAFVVSEHDPVTLEQVLQTRDLQGSSVDGRRVAVANNGRAVFATESFRSGPVKMYSSLRPSISEFVQPGATIINTHDGQVGASGDGSMLLVGSWNGTGGRDPVYRYDSNTHQLVSTPLSTAVEGFTLNRTGSRVIVSHRHVYDNALTLLGALPESTLAAALAPTDLRAYTYDADGTIRTFDVSASTGGTFAEVAPPMSIADPGTGTGHRLLVTPDGRALFLTGRTHILLVPLPE